MLILLILSLATQGRPVVAPPPKGSSGTSELLLHVPQDSYRAGRHGQGGTPAELGGWHQSPTGRSPVQADPFQPGQLRIGGAIIECVLVKGGAVGGLVTLYSALRSFWRANQRAVSRTVLVIALALFTVGQFIPAVQNLLIARGVIALVTLVVLLDLSTTVSAAVEGQALDVSSDQDQDTPRTLAFLQSHPVRRADLLEYSSASIEPLLAELKRQQAQIRLLIRHPDDVGAHQRARIIGQIRALKSIICDDNDRAEVRCYRPFSGLRGRRFGDRIVSVGWYTPDVKTKLEVRGHTNPVVTARLSTPEGQDLARMFDDLFMGLWEAPGTEDAMAVLERAAAIT